MAQDNAALLRAAYDDLVTEFRNHCADRVLGKERVTYTLNGRNFQWSAYRKQVMEELKDMTAILASNSIAYVETRVK